MVFYRLLKIRRRLSTTQYPKIDSSTKRENQEIKYYIQTFTNYLQENQLLLYPTTILALNNRDYTSTRVSLFFLNYRYHVTPLDLNRSQIVENLKTPSQKANTIVYKIKGALKITKSIIAATQQLQEEYANRYYNAILNYQVSNKVQLSLYNI